MLKVMSNLYLQHFQYLQNEPDNVNSDADERMNKEAPTSPALDSREDNSIICYFYTYVSIFIVVHGHVCSGILCSNYSLLQNFSGSGRSFVR